VLAHFLADEARVLANVAGGLGDVAAGSGEVLLEFSFFPLVVGLRFPLVV